MPRARQANWLRQAGAAVWSQVARACGYADGATARKMASPLSDATGRRRHDPPCAAGVQAPGSAARRGRRSRAGSAMRPTG